MSPLTSLINSVHHGRCSLRQRECLIALLLHLSARRGVSCPEMSQVQAAYTELLDADQPQSPRRARAPLTLDQLIEHLTELRARHPEYGPRPVHLLDMAGDNGDGLVTDVDRDCFDAARQGPVTSLLSSPLPVTFSGKWRQILSGKWRLYAELGRPHRAWTARGPHQSPREF